MTVTREDVDVSVYGVKLQRSDDLRLEAHPHHCTHENFRQWCAQKITAGQQLAVDLFSGAGGLSLGLQQAGWTVAAAADNDTKALQTHRHNFPGLALNTDLSGDDERDQFIKLFDGIPVDLVAGGPPCQPFSRAGRSKIRSLVQEGLRPHHDHRRELWRSFLDVAIELRPRAVLMENVPDMALGDDFRAVREMIDQLESNGYFTQLNLVDAWKHGVPQHRKRLILLARSDIDAFAWPQATVEPVTLADAIRDLPVVGADAGDIGGRVLPYRKQKLSAFAKQMRSGMAEPVVWDHMTRPVRDDDREIFSHMTPGMLYTDVPDHLRRYSADTFDDKYNKLSWSQLCRSITAHIAKDGYWYIHPQQPRTLTVREVARIQTFPDYFRFAGTRSDAFRQIGNAVPPHLGKAAATAVASTDTLSEVRLGTGTQLRNAKKALTEWADQERRSAAWYLLPGQHMTMPVAAIVASVLGRSSPTRALRLAISEVRGRRILSRSDVNRLQPLLSTESGRQVITQLTPLAGKRKIWNDADALSEVLKMKRVQRELFHLLIGRDVMMSSQPIVRVAARVNGTESHRVNSLTDGKIDIARLTGSGEDAPLRTAGLRVIGTTICQAARPKCQLCPLRMNCFAALAVGNDSEAPSLLDELADSEVQAA